MTEFIYFYQITIWVHHCTVLVSFYFPLTKKKYYNVIFEKYIKKNTNPLLKLLYELLLEIRSQLE